MGLYGCKKEETPAGAGAVADNTAKPNTDSTNSSSDTPEAQIRGMFEAQIEATNKEDLEGYMATVDPESAAYEPTKKAMADLFAKGDLKLTLNTSELVSQSGETAKFRTVITTKNADSSGSKITALHELQKKNGKWFIVNSTVEKNEAA
jgi:hypothetical protein